MGAQTSSIFSEIYLQYIENTNILYILLEHRVTGYFCYVDDILIVYKNDRTNIYDFLKLLSNIMPAVKFTMEEENNNEINFLDITILKE